MLDLLSEAQGAQIKHGKNIRKKVNNRVAHIDGDFIAYQIAADTRDEIDGIRPMRSLEYKLGQIEDIAHEIMDRAGANRYVLHTTPSGSDKGGRDDQAVQKEYQANRKEGAREKPEHLDDVRAALVGDFKYGKGVAHLNQEADDGLCQANVQDLKNSVLCSRDKDLRMSPGWHMDMDTDELVFIEPDEFGKIELIEKISSSGKSKTKKIVGYGPAFFWAQCLMGDSVDNIQGLPAVSGYSLSKALNPIDWEADEKLLRVPDIKSTILDRIKAKRTKTKSCGPAGTWDLIGQIDNNKDAFFTVRSLFEELAEHSGYQFRHWKTGEPVSATQALLGDMQLLWMRHTSDRNDVLRWLKQFV